MGHHENRRVCETNYEENLCIIHRARWHLNCMDDDETFFCSSFLRTRRSFLSLSNVIQLPGQNKRWRSRHDGLSNVKYPWAFIVYIYRCMCRFKRTIWIYCLSMTSMLVERPASSSYSSRSIKLFSFGCTLAVVLLTFQYEHKLRLFNSPRLMLTLPALSLISICGFGAGKMSISLPKCLPPSPLIASALVGLLYPMILSTMNQASILDYQSQTIRKSQVCKSIVIFMGINHLCAVSGLESIHWDEIDILSLFFLVLD